MSRLRDLVYDISDVLTAALIVVVAGIVIAFSINNIMGYPEMVAAQNAGSNDNFGLSAPVSEESTPAASGENPEGDSAGDSGNSSGDVYAIYINYGESMSVIGQKFVSVGYFSSVDEFMSYVEKMNAGSRIKSGNFIIPSDATKEEVIEAITQNPN